MLNSGKTYLKLLLMISLVLVLAGGCSTMQHQGNTTAALQVSASNCTTPQMVPLAAGDSLGYRIVANHPVTIAKRAEKLQMAANSNVSNY